jgi:phosphoserine phosphatase RsbU/P
MRLLRTVGRPELVAPVVQRNIGVWLALGLIVVIVGLDMVGGRNAELLGLLVSPPIVAASFVGPKRTVAVGLVALAVAIGYGRAVGVDLLAGAQGVPAVAIGVTTVLSGVVARVRVEREGRLRAVTRVAEVAQRALLGGVPRRWGACAWPCCMPRPAPRRRSGDFYEALETPHGVRLLVGDVRGKGLDAVRLAGVVLGSFRDAAQDRPDLAEVAAALDRSVTRAIGPEDFVTAVAVQVLGDGSAVVVNCGHPAPLLVRGGRATELDPPEPAPPLGLGPRPEPLRLTLALGDRILLYTDGVSEARARGAFFPLQTVAAFALVSADLEAGLESLWAELQRHVAGQLHDDVALLLIERSS